MAPGKHAKITPQHMPAVIAELSPVLLLSETVGASPLLSPDLNPIPQARSAKQHENGSPQAGGADPVHSGPSVRELPQVAHLPSNVSLSQLPVRMPIYQFVSHVLKCSQIIFNNNNQNTTYNFGRDVINNNWITNNIYLTKEEVGCSGLHRPKSVLTPVNAGEYFESDKIWYELEVSRSESILILHSD